MGSKIIKAESLLEKLAEKGISDSHLRVGAIYLRKWYSEIYLVRVAKIEINKNGGITITIEKATDWEGNSWKYYGTCTVEEWKPDTFIPVTGSIKEWMEKAEKILDGETDPSIYGDEASAPDMEETGLIAKGSKENLLILQRGMEEKRDKAHQLQAFVNYQMEMRKAKMEAMLTKLGGILSFWNKKIARIMKVIQVIELYLGIEEELFQLQEGVSALATTPINFRQRVLFMDEEVANVEDGGLDYTDIKLFDEWLLENDNYKLIIPEEKGVVVLRPRRTDKQYDSGDFMYDAQRNAENHIRTYFLIRNGQNLYRIYTERLVVSNRLFPRNTELQKILSEVAQAEKEAERYVGGNERMVEEAKDKADDAVYQYKKRAAFLQGLIERTEVFHPLIKPGLSVFRMEEAEGAFNFIYDDEEALPDGRLPFKEWVKALNQKIQHGSRIIISGNWKHAGWKYDGRDFSEDRLVGNVYRRNYPPAPASGIYEVEQYNKGSKRKEEVPHYYGEMLERKGLLISKEVCKESRYSVGYQLHPSNEFLPEDDHVVIRTFKSGGSHHIESWKCEWWEDRILTILYNPEDTVYGSWGDYKSSTREKRLRYEIKRSDNNILLNYDQISLEDIEFYLQNRNDRPNYLEMMPILRTMKAWRLQELEQEKDFVRMVVGQLIVQGSTLKEEQLALEVWKLVDWWKFKNQIKRPIDKDDSKALRMIIKKFNKELNEKT